MTRQFKIAALFVGSISLCGCFAAALAGAGAEAGYVAAQDDRTTSETLTDQRITSTVKTKLIADQTVSGLDINVDTFKSNVTLKGVVDNQDEVTQAMKIARNVSGVKGVTSKLVVQ